MNRLAIATLASSLLLSTGGVAGAQTARARIADTPIRLEANLASATIATLKEGAPVDVVDVQGDWYRVQVPDEQGPPRVGFVLARLVDLVNPDGSLQPLPAPAGRAAAPIAQGPPIPPTLTQLILQRERATAREETLKAEVDALQADLNALQVDQTPGQIRPRRVHQPVSQRSQPRDGFWFNAGLGFGSYSCEFCQSRLSGGTGDISLGGTINGKLLLGGGSAGYFRSSDNDTALTVGTLDARVRFYPVRTSGFFLTGGLGLGTISIGAVRVGAARFTEYGVGAVLGLGWDIRVGSKLSLTPFWNGVGVSTANNDVGFGQLGLGITVH